MYMCYFIIVLQKLEAAHNPVQEGNKSTVPIQEEVTKVEPVQEHRNGAYKQVDGRQEQSNGKHYMYACVYICVYLSMCKIIIIATSVRVSVFYFQYTYGITNSEQCSVSHGI